MNGEEMLVEGGGSVQGSKEVSISSNTNALGAF